MIDDVLVLIKRRSFTECMSEIKNHRVDTLDVVNKLLYLSRISDLQWFYLNMRIYGYVKV